MTATTLLLAVAPVAAATPGRDTSQSCPRGDHPFTDVGGVHAPAITCVHLLGITTGRTPTTYEPGGALRRDQLASLLVRTLEAAGHPLPEPAADPYDDLAGSVHADAIGRLVAAGALPGGGEFRGRTPVDRAEMAVMTAAALRATGTLATTDRDLFTDDDRLPAATRRAIDELAMAGVVTGVDTGQYRPELVLRRDQMASILTRAHDLVVTGGRAPATVPPAPYSRSPEGWIVAGGTTDVAGRSGTVTRYTVEIADGLQTRQDVSDFARRVERALHEPGHGWTARGEHRLQRVASPAEARIRVVLGNPATVDRLCRQAGLNTAGIYSCWNGRVAALNADRWFGGVRHVADLQLYRTYLVNHEVGHGLGHGHRDCPGRGRTAPVMMQLSKSTYGCVPNPWPYP
ncbi:DUF3152 domain-containing protein [Egicoccus sp. AB-alg6-2]|uniref:DUF3152 domain-containing protein n=1 Tax=Egicoccus sp. AB-alg6-2 TaxID=3242692 RepID=UPI00359F01B3